jgi:tetratricopeptide (TPR) repeat protein
VPFSEARGLFSVGRRCLEPDLARAHYHLGALCAARGYVEAAQRAYQRAIDLDTEGLYRQRAEKASEERH